MINTILLVNYCEIIDTGFAGTAFTLAAGSKPSEADDAELMEKIKFDTGSGDYLGIEITLPNSTVTLLDGDMILISDNNVLSVVLEPTEELAKIIIENSGLEVHSLTNKHFD